jgi:hypothetical protein
LPNVIGQFHRIYAAVLEDAVQNGEEEETEEISQTLAPFSQAFSVFDPVEWSELTRDDWQGLGGSVFFDIVYTALTSDFDQILLALTPHKEASAAEYEHNQAISNGAIPRDDPLPIRIPQGEAGRTKTSPASNQRT